MPKLLPKHAKNIRSKRNVASFDTNLPGAVKESWEEFVKQTKIRSGKKVMTFLPYDYQKLFVKQVQTHYGTVAIKTRQIGLTEVVVSLFLYWAKDNPAFLGVVFSKSQDDTKNIARRCRLMANSHPDINLETDSLQDIKLEGGGRIVFKPSTPNAARSLESVSAILFDECAFVSEIEDIYGSAMPATETLGEDPIHGAKIVILSTPNGRQGFYWTRVNEHNPRDVLQVCEDVREGRSPPVQTWTDKEGWCKFIAHWKAHPVYRDRPNYLQAQKTSKRLTDAQVQREYNLGFDASIARVFKDDFIANSVKGAWSEPKPHRQYLAGIDPSFGGEDFFTVRVWDVTRPPYRLVAQYRDRQKTIDFFIQKAAALLTPYSRSRSFMIGCETNSGGALVQQELTRLKPMWRVECVVMSNASKMLHTDRLVLMLERNHLHFPPEPENVLDEDNPETINLVGVSEYAHFVEEFSGATRTRKSESGFHDDTVLADGVAFSLIDELPKAIRGGVEAASHNPIQKVLSEL